METKVCQGFKLSVWISSENIGRKSSNSLQFFSRNGNQGLYRATTSVKLLTRKGVSHKPAKLKVLGSSESVSASALQSDNLPASCDECLILKNKSEEIEPCLNGRCIYLVGMMGSGKTTVGKTLSDALGYSFCDCDTIIEQDAGYSVAEIFKNYGESFFRDKETKALQKLSGMHRLVVSTGGGAVIRPINWRYMENGISVWLDVPLEALAQRITVAGTNSRPLLDQESGDPYTKTLERLTNLLEERGDAYSIADARVSLEMMAAKLGLGDVCSVTPCAIAVEVLSQIKISLNQREETLRDSFIPS